MTNWLLRGLVSAAGMVVLRLVQGALIAVWQTRSGLISIVLLILFAASVVVWGVLDGRADAIANPDPDRRRDLAMTWLLAGLVAGVLSGAVTWVISLFDKALYVGGLLSELTTFASFTALVVFLAGIGGVTGGRWFIDRNPRPVARIPGADEDRVDTDVFAAVRGDDTSTGGLAAQAGQQGSAVATAQREYGTEAAPTAWAAEPTQAAQTAPTAWGAEPTGAVPSAQPGEATEATAQREEATGAEQTKPTPAAEEDQP